MNDIYMPFLCFFAVFSKKIVYLQNNYQNKYAEFLKKDRFFLTEV